MISEVDYRCIDCKRSINSLHYKRLKTLVQRCRPCFKAFSDGRCCYVKKGVQCQFKPDTSFSRYCSKHAAFEPVEQSQQRTRSSRSKAHQTNDDLPSFNFSDSDFPSSSSSSSPPRTRGSRPKEPKFKHEEVDFQTSSSMTLFGIASRSALSTITSRELKRIYLTKALSLHPDKNIGVDTTDKFQALQSAYDFLKDFVARWHGVFLCYADFDFDCSNVCMDVIVMCKWDI